MRFLIISLILLFAGYGGEVFAFRKDKEPDIEQAKAELKTLSAEINRINEEAAPEMERASFEKFETLRQERELRVAGVMKRIGPLLKTEFGRPMIFRLGEYDADKQLFPLHQEEDDTLIGNLFVPLAEALELKTGFSSAAAFGTFSLYIDFADRIRELPLGAQVIFTGRTYKTVRQKMDTERAMKLLYPGYNSLAKRATVELNKAELMEGTFNNVHYLNQPIFATPFFQQIYVEGNKQKFIILTGAKPEDHNCHACGVLVGVAIFEESASGWKVDLAQRSIGRYFSYGDTKEPKIERIGSEHHAITFEWGDGGQGYYAGRFFILTAIDHSFRKVGQIESHLNIPGFPPIFEYYYFRGKYKIITRPNSEYFDIKVIHLGSKGSGEGRTRVSMPFSKIVWYRFVNNKYVEYSPATTGTRSSISGIK